MDCNKEIVKHESEPIILIKSFYPLVLLRRVYLSINLFSNKGVINYASSSAFYFLFSIIPLAMFFVIIFDNIFSNYSEVSTAFFDLLGKINPHINKDFFQSIGLFNDNNKSLFGIIGFIGLLWSSRYVFESINSAFNVIFNTVSKRNYFINNLIAMFSVPIIFVICILFIISGIVLKSANSLFVKYNIPFLSSSTALNLSTNISLALLVFLIVFSLYRFLPKLRPRSVHAIVGAVLFTIFIAILQSGLTGVVKVAQYYLLYGVISVVIAGLFWVYILFGLFYFFAQLVYVQQHYTALEIISYYTRIVPKRANFIERLLFRNTEYADNVFGVSYNAGDIITKIGEQADYFYIVRNGSVKVEHMDTVIHKDSLFGIRGVVSGTQYESTTIADSDCVVLKIPKEFYDDLVALEPRFAENIINSLI